MGKYLSAALGIGLAIMHNGYAGTMGEVPRDWTWVGTLSVGAVWADPGESQTFYLAPQIEKTYHTRNVNTVMPEGAVFLGIQRALTSVLLGQLGLEAAYAGNAKLQGQIWDDADRLFNNYTYRYNVEHSHLALKGKLLADRGWIITPWISGGLGLAWNYAYNFTNTPIIFEAITNPNFANHTKSSLTYNLGIGVQKDINTHWQWGVGYEFADWGESRLGRAAEQVFGSGLSLDHVYTNGVLFNLTYVA